MVGCPWTTSRRTMRCGIVFRQTSQALVTITGGSPSTGDGRRRERPVPGTARSAGDSAGRRSRARAPAWSRRERIAAQRVPRWPCCPRRSGRAPSPPGAERRMCRIESRWPWRDTRRREARPHRGSCQSHARGPCASRGTVTPVGWSWRARGRSGAGIFATSCRNGPAEHRSGETRYWRRQPVTKAVTGGLEPPSGGGSP